MSQNKPAWKIREAKTLRKVKQREQRHRKAFNKRNGADQNLEPDLDFLMSRDDFIDIPLPVRISPQKKNQFV